MEPEKTENPQEKSQEDWEEALCRQLEEEGCYGL